MLVGRETAGGNTLNGKYTMALVQELIPDAIIERVVEEAVALYRKYLSVETIEQQTSNHVAASRSIISEWHGK